MSTAVSVTHDHALQRALPARPLDVLGEVDAAEFRAKYYTPEEPCVLTTAAKRWPAVEKWTSEYLKATCGGSYVGTVDDGYGKAGATYLSNQRSMPLAEYLDQIEAGPSKLRLFIWPFMRNAKELIADIMEPAPYAPSGPNVRCKGVHIFAGGTGSTAHFHYDLDMRNVFHTVVRGKKRVLLVAPKHSKDLYRHPLTTRTYVDVDRPDFARYPRLANVELRTATLEAGQTLFIPRGWWHYFHYLDRGFAVTHRYSVDGPFAGLHFAWNMGRNVTDRLLNKAFGERWFNARERWVVGRNVR